MTTIMPAIHLDAIPTPGQLLGTGNIASTLNDDLGMDRGFFGSVHDIFNKGRSVFINNIVEPIRKIAHKVTGAAHKLIENDVIIPFIKAEDFKYVPPSMHLPILLYEPVKELHAQGRIDGWGYDPDNLPEEDAYGRLISNGTVEDVYSAIDKNGEIQLEWEWRSTDPEITFDEIDYIAQTRKAIDEMLADTSYDPTCYPFSRS